MGDERRWTIYVCPECRRSTLDFKHGIDCECEVEAWDPVEVVPASGLRAERERAERLEKALEPFVAIAAEADMRGHKPGSSCLWRISYDELAAAREALG